MSAKLREVSQCPGKAPTRVSSMLKVAASASTEYLQTSFLFQVYLPLNPYLIVNRLLIVKVQIGPSPDTVKLR